MRFRPLLTFLSSFLPAVLWVYAWLLPLPLLAAAPPARAETATRTTAPPPDAAGRGTLTGRVRTPDGKPAEQISVALLGTRFGTATDAQGHYRLLNVPTGSYTLVASGLGYAPTRVAVRVQHGETTAVPDLALTAAATDLDEVTVAAEKPRYVVEKPSESLRLNAPLLEVPQNISVATTQTFRDFGIVGTAEMSRLTSGIVRRYGGANDFAFNIRGTDATNNVFRNGVGGYWWNQQSDAFMLERVEFVKGPAGFMIGNAEPGGLLNEVTKQADGRRVREAEVGYGSWNLLRAGVDVGDTFSPKSRFSYRVVVGGQRTNATYDFYRASRTYVLPSVRYAYGSGSYVQAEVIRMDGFVKADNYNNVSRTGRNDWLFPLTFNATDPGAVRGIQTDDQYVRLAHTHRFGNSGWQLKTQLADVRGVYDGDYMYVSRPSVAFDTLYRGYGRTDWRNRLQAAQTFLDGSFSTGEHLHHSVLVGLDFGKSWVSSAWGEAADTDDVWGNDLPLVVAQPTYNLAHNQLAPTTTLNPADSWGTQWTALYAQDHLKIADRVVLTVAGRLSHTRAWASYDSATVRGTRFTPRLGLTYLLNDRMSVYVLRDETFLPQTGRKKTGSAPPLTGQNWEVGYKAQLLDRRLALNAGVFRTIENNVLVQDPQQTQFYEERGQITSQGVEADVVGNLTDNIVANVNYTYTDARITRDLNPENIGFRNYGVARHTANAMLRYKLLQGALRGLSVGAGAQLMGARSAVWAGYTAATDRDKTSPAYTLLDANVGYETARLSLRANVFNLLNTRGMDNAWWNSAADENTPGYFTFSPIQPVNFRVMMGYKL